MVQNVFTGGADDNQLDASAFTTTVVLRGLAGRDILIGGSGADRIDGGLGADLLQGGAGNDQFFVALGKDLVAGQYDIIEGGTGNDELIITLNSAQLGTAEMKVELARLKTFLADHGSDPTAHFISDVLHVDLSGVEAARLRVDGVMKTLAEVVPDQPLPGAMKIAVIELHGYSATVTEALTDLSIFHSVTRIDAGSGTPTFDELKNYDTVVWISDAGPSNPTELGNNLASYVDAGGHLITTTFDAQYTDFQDYGRLEADGYLPWTSNNTSYAPSTTAPLPEHELFNIVYDINSISAQSYREISNPSSDATTIGQWQDGTPLVMIDGGSGVLNLTYYPVPGVGAPASGDYIELLANAIVYSEYHL
ncbi:hypothetical protein ACFQS7_29390 [Dankookia sp. GCM10030260]|uniref:hypothetical protein n=1 Tax=Dankookia sp. GCM10030260 TaxID=3273390 RepID=UPI003611B3F7